MFLYMKVLILEILVPVLKQVSVCKCDLGILQTDLKHVFVDMCDLVRFQSIFRVESLRTNKTTERFLSSMNSLVSA